MSMTKWYQWARFRTPLLLGLLLTLAACSRPGFLVRTAPAVVPLVDASRAEVAARVGELETATSNGSLRGDDLRDAQAELARLQLRLDRGDFQVGDQIIVTVTQIDGVGVDTASVRDGMVISFAALPDASVAGVLLSEIQPRLQDHLDKYIKNATVRVNLTLRLQIVGFVGRPGFYVISPDRPVSEILALAGGLQASAKLDEVTIRRNGRVIVKPKQWQDAVKVGTTVAQLGLRPGDEVEIGGEKPRNWLQILRSIGFIATGLFSIIRLLQLFYRE